MLKLASDFPKKIYEYVNTNNKYHPNLKKLIQNIYKFLNININMNFELLSNLFPFCNIPLLLKISMTSRKNNKIISEIIDKHFINAHAFNLTRNDIMFIPKFVEYLFDSSRIKEYVHLNMLVKQLTPKEHAVYKFFKNPTKYLFQMQNKDFKLNHYAKYMKYAIEQNPLLFKYGTHEFRCQDFWGRRSLDADIRNFPYVSWRLRSNEYYATRAVEHNGLFLEHAYKLRNNKEICLIAFEQNILSIKYIGKFLRNDKDFIKELYLKNNDVLSYFGLTFIFILFENDKDFIKEICLKNSYALSYFEFTSIF